MVNAVGGGPQAAPVKKPEEKKEEKKPESQAPAPSPAPAEKPNAGNTGSTDVNAPKDGLDPKAAFAVSQRLNTKSTGDETKPKKAGEPKEKADKAGRPEEAGDADEAARGVLEGIMGKMKPENEDDKKGGQENGQGINPIGGTSPTAGRGDGKGTKEKPEKEGPTSKGLDALNYLSANDNETLKKLDVARDKVDRGKENPGTDDKISTDDLEAALSQKGYLSEDERKAVQTILDTGVWDEINGKDSKATFKEIDDYRDRADKVLEKAKELGITDEGSPKAASLKDWAKMTEQVDKLPAHVKEKFKAEGVQHVLINGKFTDHPDNASWKGKETPTPGDGNRTYDNVGAAASNNKIYYPLGGSPEDAVFHESGHIYDSLAGDKGSGSQDWKELHKKHQDMDIMGDAYFKDSPNEAFAEAFERYYDGHRDQLPDDMQDYFASLE